MGGGRPPFRPDLSPPAPSCFGSPGVWVGGARVRRGLRPGGCSWSRRLCRPRDRIGPHLVARELPLDALAAHDAVLLRVPDVAVVAAESERALVGAKCSEHFGPRVFFFAISSSRITSRSTSRMGHTSDPVGRLSRTR